MIKAAARERGLLYRNGLSREDVDLFSKIITKKTLENNSVKESEIIFCYLSAFNEVATLDLITALLSQQKKIVVPKVIDREWMIAVEIDSLEDLISNPYHILEPKAPTAYEGKIDVAICPGTAFSRNKDRVGMGKGYYDRFFERYFVPYKIGLSFEGQVIESIDINKNDVPMNIIITEKKVI